MSLLDLYQKTKRRLEALEQDGKIVLWGAEPSGAGDLIDTGLPALFAGLAEIAQEHGMEIVSCAEPYDLSAYGISHGACVDADMLQAALGTVVSRRKDPGQRRECRCVVSRDIGVYDTCLHGCVYCYATNVPHAQRRHDPHAPALSGGVACMRQVRPGE